jgi:hypothetical protein
MSVISSRRPCAAGALWPLALFLLLAQAGLWLWHAWPQVMMKVSSGSVR